MSLRGLLAGMNGHVTQPLPGMPRYTGELIWHPVKATAVNAITAGSTWTADKTTALTSDISGLGGVPVDGSVVGLSGFVLCSNSSVNSGTYVEVMDYGASRAVGDSPGTAPTHAYQVYGGKVANHYSSASFDLIYTGGLNNTQFKYAVSWGAGTTTGYIRITGYWTRA